MVEVPRDVMALVEERERRRAERDFAAADALRDRIRHLGFDLEDTPTGPMVSPFRRPLSRLTPGQVASVLDRVPRFDVSVHWLVQGWPEDAARGIASFRRTQGPHSVQHVVVDCVETEPQTWPEEVEVVGLDRDHGWGASRNAGLKRTAGRVVLVVDSSVEATGDVLGPLIEALHDPFVGIAGPVGAVTEDLHEFHPSAGPEVDAIEGYLMAFRREVVMRAGMFDERFRFYRAADLEMSFRVRDLGLRAITVPVPIERHEHRMWNATPEPERERLSKRNYYRFLQRWRGRLDLCSGTAAGSR